MKDYRRNTLSFETCMDILDWFNDENHDYMVPLMLVPAELTKSVLLRWSYWWRVTGAYAVVAPCQWWSLVLYSLPP